MTAPSPPDVDALFAHGARHRWANSDDSRLDVVLVGDVSLPSGQVVVRDPGRWVQDDAEQREPFSFVARPGDWRVVIAIAHWDDSPDPRVPAPIRRPVAVKAEFGEAEVQSWELGLRPGDELPGGDTEDLPGFGVDGSVGWLLDATDLGFLRRLQQASEDDLLEFLEAADSDDAKIINDPGLSGSIVAFNCGMGDGVYPVWIGRDAEGHPVSIVIDLELLSHSLGMIE